MKNPLESNQLQGSGINKTKENKVLSNKRIETIVRIKDDFVKNAKQDGSETAHMSQTFQPIPKFDNKYRDWLEKVRTQYPKIPNCTWKNAGMTCENYNRIALSVWNDSLAHKFKAKEWTAEYQTDKGVFTYYTSKRILTNNSYITIRNVPREDVIRALAKVLQMYNSYEIINVDFESLMVVENY